MDGLCASGGHALVVPVQAAGLVDLNDLANLRRLRSPRLRTVHFQGLVAAPAVVVGKVVWLQSRTPPALKRGQVDAAG